MDAGAAMTPPLAPGRATAVAAVLTAMALVVLDAGVVNLALPTMAATFGASPAEVMLVITAYQAALAASLLPCGALGERLGHRRVFVGGVAIFILASVLCAAAPSLAWLVAARALQGLGGAAVMALGVALLRLSVPGERLGAAIGWNALVVALTAAAAPSLGALVVSAADWRWLFGLNLPVGAAALIAGYALPGQQGSPRGLDLVSMALNAAVFASAATAVELAPDRPAAAVLLAAVSALGLIALIRREAPKSAPLVPLDLLRQGSFRLSVVASVFCFTGQTAGLIALSFHLQHDVGLSAASAGLYLTAWPLSVAAAAIVSSRLADRLSSAWLCGVGASVLAAGLLACALWPGRTDPIWLAAFAGICGLGFGLFQTPNNRNMLLAAPAERSGAAGGMQGTARLTGQMAGALLLTTLFKLGPAQDASRLAFGLGAVMALAAAGASVSKARSRRPGLAVEAKASP